MNSQQNRNSALERLIQMSYGTLMETLGIEILEASSSKVVAKMPVTPKVHQPFGFLHGGASVALAETVASIGAYFSVVDRGMLAFGLEINANHLRPKKSGIVTATATPIHQGRSTEVWEIRITDEENQDICISRCTIALVKGPLRE
jgi:1,4-dihydroxy-2-naphthoyl-CoA hydrolase